MNKLGTCLSEVDLNDYLSGALSPERRPAIEDHLKDCNACLEKTVFAYETVAELNKTGSKGVKTVSKSKWKNNLWLFGAIIAFALSFFVPRYFVQLLVATILMGTKWIFDSVNARILIMIYDAWQHGGEKEASKVLKNLNKRF
ncbi:MAG: zf-HC2 domain-containing protein [Candidatus Omnitrophota bacterium]